MAKKKKAPEAKAPLRGLQDTPTSTNSYIVHDPDHELAMIVTDGSVDKVLLDGEELGGGGGLSTYTLNIINNSINNGLVFTGVIDDDGYLYCEWSIPPESSVTLDILVSNGETSELYLSYDGSNPVPDNKVTASGCTYGIGFIVMTGDGTVTISN